jgi:hypothetical protein
MEEQVELNFCIPSCCITYAEETIRATTKRGISNAIIGT